MRDGKVGHGGDMLIPVDKKRGLTVCDSEVEDMTFADLGLTENQVEEFLRKNIEVVFDDSETLLIVGQQVINASLGRSDLVALDENGSIVLIEIKRDVSDIRNRREPFEFQAIRYAASLAKIADPDDLVDRIFVRYIEKHSSEFTPGDLTYPELGKRIVTDFLQKNNAVRTFNQKQRIILLASDFDDQTLSAVAWLISNGLEIAAFRITPKRFQEQIFFEASRILPPEDIEDFYVDIASPQHSDVATPRGNRTRTNLPRMKKLMEWGIVDPGDILVIVNQDDSEAEVIDHKRVKYKGKEMSFNEWGSRVTGWSSICIYDWAKHKEATETLSELRKQKMDESEGGEKDGA